MSKKMTPEFLPLGDCGVRMEFGSEISPVTNARIRRFGEALDADPVAGMIEWVCGYTVITVYYQPRIIGYDDLCFALLRRLRRRIESETLPARLIEIPVCYGGLFGPDLEEVAAGHKLTAAQVIQKHSRPSYRVYFLGFLPGFAYLGGLPPCLWTPRRMTPRSSVPAGAVGIAGEQTGVYPVDSPGGWQIIGRTPRPLYDPQRGYPALLSAGDRVKFIPISSSSFDTYEEPGEEPCRAAH